MYVVDVAEPTALDAVADDVSTSTAIAWNGLSGPFGMSTNGRPDDTVEHPVGEQPSQADDQGGIPTDGAAGAQSAGRHGLRDDPGGGVGRHP
ncbi:hypothetical protein AB0I90_15535 [Micromonospora wenchangensis]|uniref:hypothetical protein n=1 Tax=Micromonospora wenchangensis TaxID=1185415 RepID=UPI0033F3396C